MKSLVHTLFKALPDFLNVGVFLLFIFIIFGILGLHEYNGSFYYMCRTTEFPITDSSGYRYWPMDSTQTTICSPDGSGEYICNPGTWCGSPVDYGISLDTDNVFSNSNINFGIGTFDNIGKSLILLWQVIT
jgi:hypothetical protein